MHENTLRKEIIDFRNKLELLADKLRDFNNTVVPGVLFDWEFNPTPNFPDKRNYPIDFQIFMEEIGEFAVAMGYDGVGRTDSRLILRVEIPRNVRRYYDDYEAGKSNLIINTFAFSDDEETEEYVVADVYEGVNTMFMRVFAACEESPYCFVTTTVPYIFWNLKTPTKDETFWNWLKNHFAENLKRDDISL